jgi:hypothetical protein
MRRVQRMVFVVTALSAVGLTADSARAAAAQAAPQPAVNARAAKGAKAAWTAPKTGWGDPDLSGVYTNNDESLIPFERPAELAGKKLTDITPAELEKLVEQRDEQRAEADRNRAELRSPIHWFENIFPSNSRAWLVSDPPDGKVPPVTAEAQQRNAARARERAAHGPADSPEDRSLYDRCITRGIPGSMMPAIYGNAYEIVQGPGYVVITYEMVHEARVIPLAPAPHAGASIRMYMGDARGHWEGNTLVVETTNFTDKTAYRGSSENLKLIERFTRTAPDTVEWSSTFDDPHTWTTPWTFAMNLSRKDDSQRPFEYACHEGNYAMTHLLLAARADDKTAADDAKTGAVRAGRPTGADEQER